MDPNYIVFLISELLTSELAKTFGRDLINIVASKGIVLGSRYLWQKCINDQDSFSLDEYEQFKQVHPDIANYEGFKKTLAKVCNDLASKITRTPSKDLTNPEALVQLLGDWVFHDLLAKWIISVTPEKREEAKAEVIDELVKSLEGVGVDRNPAERAIDILLEQFAREFDDNSVLRGWKVPLQIDYMVSVLGEQEAGLRKINGMLHYLMYGKVPQKTIHSIMERYQCYLLKECSNIISPITMSLEDFYVELPLEVEERPLLFTGEGDMQEGKATRRVDTKDLLQESNCIAILGNSGTGKSTLLNWLAYVNIVPYMNFPDGVVLIRCRELDQRVQQGSMEDILKSHFGRLFSSKEAEMLALYSRNRLEEGKVLLLLDGLDELKNDRETRRKFFENAIELSRRCPHSKIVMTSRTAAYQEICECVKPEFIPRVKKAQFQGLKIQDKKKLIEVWAGKKNMKKQGEKLLNLLTENCEINLITDTPLMFSLLLLIFQESEMSLPQNKAELYDKALTKLLEERKEHPHDASFTKSEIFPLLEYLALVMSRKERLQIEESEIIKLFDDFHRNLKQTKYEYIPVGNGSNIKIRQSVRYKESSYIINDAKDFLSKLKYSSSLFLLKEEISEKKTASAYGNFDIWGIRNTCLPELSLTNTGGRRKRKRRIKEY